MGYLSRQPTSNDPPRLKGGKSPWLGDNELMDEVALLLSDMAKRCAECKRATHVRHLDSSQHCPDCAKGEIPRERNSEPVHACGAVGRRLCPCGTCTSELCLICLVDCLY